MKRENEQSSGVITVIGRAISARLVAARQRRLPSISLAVVLALLLSVVALSARADMICRSPGGIHGYSTEASTGKHLVGSDTSDPRQLKVYLTHRDNELYAHSNFVTDIMIQDHDGTVARNVVPTKIALDTQLDFPAIVMNLLGGQQLYG